MKNFLKIIALPLLLMIISCRHQIENHGQTKAAPPFDATAEQEAIMKVIDHETKSFFDGNYEEWAKSWSHQDYAIQAWNNDNGSSDVAVGWDKINAQGKNWIEKYYKNGDNVIHPHYVRRNIQTKFFSDSLAYLNWEQLNADAEKKFYRVSNEIRIMEKEADGWKIVNVSAFWDSQLKISADSLDMILAR